MRHLLDLLFDERTVGRCLVAADGTILRANAEWLRSTGFPHDDVLGADIVAFSPATRDTVLAMHAHARAGHHVEVPRQARHVEGRETWWEGSIDPVPLDGGTGLLITAREVSPRGDDQGVSVPSAAANAGNAPATDPGRAESGFEERLRLVIEAMPQIVCLVEPDGRPEYVNSAWTAFSGLDLEATARAGWLGFLHPDDVAAAGECRLRALKSLAPQHAELRYRAADGTYRWFLSRLAPIVEGGRVARLIGAALDIEDRKRAEAAMRESEEQARVSEQRARGQLAEIEAIYANAPVGLCVFDRDLRWVRLNERAAEVDGLSLEAHIGKTPRELLPDVGEQAEAALRKVLETGEPLLDVEFTGTTTTQPGVARFWNERWVPIKDGEGRILGISVAIQEITDRKRTELELREANLRLRDADQRKNEFLGMLSHELRNPLAPIRNALYILDRAEPAGQQARRAKEVVNRQLTHLTRLVDDLLDVTRIGRGKIELRRTDVDLAALGRRTAEDHRALMQVRGLDLKVDVPDERLVVNGDDTRLAQVLGNLLSNAAKFTPAGGRVTLTVRADGRHAVVHVQDTGPGIEPHMLLSIFEPFTQATQTLARSDGGLGLGLALVKGLVALHGGEVLAVSGGTGEGTDFVVRLPLGAATTAAVAERDGAAVARPAPFRRRVLVVDDNEDAAETLAQLVEMLGHDAEVAYDGPSAITKAREYAPDLILCDIGLPGMDGYEVARQLRGRGTAARIVAVSGYAQPEDVAKATEAGFDGHVAKPPDPEEIAQVIRSYAETSPSATGARSTSSGLTSARPSCAS
ncbi:PAS domain-containing hybrid sensor histidine kinase/response regulator [Anaeromyxobacter terrae]|uniref:PAS domain-containing hybrid sensor histidine kinase/response regulator n=1 Tax=Anaeromyxobacter terrae TaxID=2925406 RepID=UPI001F5657C3|nr:PAS domain-containing protein [Anaeromyxobacter sp. SG22]